MITWIGAALLLGATTWIGFEYSRQLNLRPKQIRQLKNALQILEAEIAYSQTPLHVAFSLIGNQVPKPTSLLFKELGTRLQAGQADFNDTWKDAVSKHVTDTALGSNEKEILLQFGRTLGQHELYQQEKHLLLAASHLERELEEARNAQQKYGKMAKTLGFLGGLFILLMFI